MKQIMFFILTIFMATNGTCQIDKKVILTNISSDFNIQYKDSLTDRLKYDNYNIQQKGIVLYPQGGSYLLTGYSYGEFYDWDLYFENIYMSYFGVNDYCFTNLKAFLKRQHLNGFVSRTLKEPRPYQQFKPFLAQIALLGSIQRDDFNWLNEVVEGAKNKGIAEGGIMNEENFVNGRSYYTRLKEYLNFWFWYQDFDKNGLPVWNSSDHSGMDNQISRSGNLNAFRYEGVDLACYLYRELNSMAVLAEKLNLPEDVKIYQDKAVKLKKQINEIFWDDKEGFYFDRDEQTGAPVKVKSVAGFLPLFAGVASKKQAERLVKEHLLNKNEFWTEYPIPAYAKSEPDYAQYPPTHGECNWRGTTWVPTNYMVFHGLLDYGYTDIAKDLVRKTFDMAFVKNITTREYYNAETGSGNGLNPFWGWSTLAYFMPLEYEMKYNPTDLNSKEIQPIGNNILNTTFKVTREPSEYTVKRLEKSMVIDGNWDKAQWKAIDPIDINNFMGLSPNFRPTTQAKLMYDDNYIYVIFRATDASVRCNTKEINGPVWEDNCAEFFFSPDTNSPLKYFNLEINCGGIPLMHYNAVAKNNIRTLEVEDIRKIEIAHSFIPENEQESMLPKTWTLEYKIPIAMLEKYSKVAHPENGVTWTANFYKIAHKSANSHYMSWSFVDIEPKDVDMHLPEFFGKLNFQ